ncbi:hypothetical protein CBR_g17710 [Chara braunii]|uniref:Integrase zinc-binding domain-containing protein n=1 Tax=Chara braunii TaxID=69332 RepID=A0A388KV97_CHABU|nr:hypothetical protein CBR_g17710 [Chara braunii]|eukprot:GBG74000.1 hypothetical protein CBR_g17710 [Chara braunii]
MPEEMADGGRRLVTLDDLIDALDKRERAPSNVPKVETFHFKGDRVSDWLDLSEQALVGLSDEVKLQRVLRIWQERQVPGVRVEEIVDENEEVTQRLKAGTIKEEPIVVESDYEAQEVVRESTLTILERMEDLLAKVGRYQEWLRVMCEVAREWEMNLFEVQEEEDEGDDEEDERLRQEEDRRAEQRAKKRGAKGGVEPSLHDGVPKRKKYAVRLEEGFHVERMVDKFLEGHNDQMNLKDILASAPRLRGELKGRLSRRHEGTMILALSVPACGNYEIIKCRNTGPGSVRNRLNLGSFTFEESEYARRRLREEQEEEGASEVLSLNLNDVNKAMQVVAAHDMADPEAIKALREQVLENPQVGEVELIYRLPGRKGDPAMAQTRTTIRPFLGDGLSMAPKGGDKNRADGLSRINWDGANRESIEDTPPVDGSLDQEEDVRLHINEWSLRVPSCVTHPIWLAPRGYERKEELVLKPFQEEDPWGNKDVGWMMKLALAGAHSLAEEVRTIEEGPTQVEEHEQLIGGMYLLTNTLLQGNFNQRSAAGSEESELLIPESQDDEFEEGEIREAFRVEEYDGIYREMGLLLSCEIRDRDVSAKAQKMRHLYVVRDDHLFIKRQVENPKRIVCGRNRQIDVIASLHDGIAGGHKGVSATCGKISELYHWDGMLTMVVKYCQSCVPCQQRSAQRPGEPLHPKLEREELDIPRETPFRSLVTHLDASRWEASRLGEGSVEATCYVPLEEPLDPETEMDMRDQKEPQDLEMAAEQPDPVWPQGGEVITVRDDTPPRSPVPEPAQYSWPEGIPEPGSEEIPESPPEATTTPEQEVEVEGQGACERARTEAPLDLPSATHVTKSIVIEEPVPAELPPVVPCASEEMGAEASTPKGQGPQVRRAQRETREEKSARVRVRLDEIHARQAEMEAAGIETTPLVEPKASEQRIDELWARYESQRDAARQRSREAGQADEETGELREMGDLSNELRVKELEVEHLTTQLAEKKARSQAREVEWERRFGEMADTVDRLSADWEASQVERAGADGQGRGMQASPSQGLAVEVPRQVEPMEEVPLDAVEEEGGAQESLMAMSTERRGSRLHELVAPMGIGTPQEGP